MFCQGDICGTHIHRVAQEQTQANERRVAVCGAANFHNAMDKEYKASSGELAIRITRRVTALLVNVAQGMVSQCRSAKRALIRCRLF